MKAFSVGGVDYISKPFQVEEVLARVETQLAFQHLQKTLREKNEELATTNEELVNTLQQPGGKVERIDTINLGFPLGLEEELADFIGQEQVQLNAGDVVVLYTDGITEAFDINQEQYGLERLCEVASRNSSLSVKEIRQAVIDDVRRHIGEQKVFDDITLVVLKQK